MRRPFIIVLCVVVAGSTAFAEIEKFVTPSDQGLCFHWWPKLPSVDGWHPDRENSLGYAANALAPDGFTFGDAETVMYAKAIYKPREPESKSVDMLIENDKKDFLADTPDIAIEAAGSLTTADGQVLRSFTFFPKSKGNWERVSYGEEGEYYLIFTVSSRSLKGYSAAMTAYEQLIGRYKEKP
jgi:hypothetical protein